MKYNYLLLTIVLLAISSCDLTREPEATMAPDNYFKTTAQLALWTDGYYSQMDPADNCAMQNADDNIDNNLGDLMMGQRSPESETAWTWTMLRRINYYFENSWRFTGTQADKDKHDGTSYFMRAYFYFVKVRRYGNVPWYNHVILDSDTESLRKPRQDREIIMDSIMQDLDKAIKMLPTGKDVARVTKWTALALKSRVALFEGTFRKYHNLSNADKYLKQAADAAEEFINSSKYVLYSSGDEPYRDLFNSFDAKADEVILARKYSTVANVMHGVQFKITNEKQGFTKRFMNHYLMADGSFYSSQENYDTKVFAEEVANRDPRLSQTVLSPGYVQVGDTKVTANALNALTGYQPIKYVNSSAFNGDNKSYTDYPLFRTAEVYLNFAEAKAELGTITQSDLDKSINKLRDRARMPHMDLATANSVKDPLMVEYYPNVTQGQNTGVILEIRRERTVELCMEGFRQWDIIRWKEGKQLTNPFYGCYFPGEGEYDMDGDGTADLKISTGDKGSFKGTFKKIGKDIFLTDGNSGYIHALKTIPVTWDENRDYLWPIPSSEIVLSGMSLEQNPGW